MSELAPLISDLALILICAGVMTLVFKRLKQPLVLGYIVAGFLASPHVPLTPSVIDVANIHTWSEIGVIFLLFALGLEFSFKKLVKVGGTAVIAACTIIFCMILVGIFVGWSFGWQRMDCLYLGGMLAMSSTTIIYKAFDDLGLRQQRFAGLVLSILILEDILAIVLMVMLSTMAVSQNFEGSEMVYSIAKLLFFLILWFVVGIYIIPTFLKRSRKWMANETLLIVSLALCFGMVVVAAKVGFSAAFGAFIMGSILAETVEAENIEKLVAPVKDLFGAIFFVSVGMMVDPAMIVEYIWPIVIITLAILLGQVIFGTGGSSGSQTVNHENNWKKLLVAIARIVAVYSVLCIAMITLSFHFIIPLFRASLPVFWANLAGTVFTIVCIAPFLRAIIMKKNHSVEFQALWQDSRFNRAPLISTILLRIVIAVMFVMFVIEKLFQTSTTLLIGIAVVLVGMMMFSRWLKKQSIFMERTFIQNLRFRDVHAEFTGQKRPEYEGHLLSRDLHLSDFEIPADSLWAGYTLRELNLGHKYGVHVASIIRGMHRINIPGANVRLFPGDTIQVIGTDEQLGEFARQAERVSAAAEEEDLERREMNLKQFIIDRNSFFLGKNIKESGIRDEYKCLVVGVEKEDSTLMTPDINVPFTEGDVVWVVGERDDVYRLLGKKEKEEE